jgi:putative ABC transport system permease protein
VLEPTNSPSDHVIWIPLEGIFRMPGHELKDKFVPKPGEEIPDSTKEISAVMLKLTSPDMGMDLSTQINRQGKEATLAWPIDSVLLDLFKKIGWVDKVLEQVAYLVVVVAAGSILASIYNTMNERRREFAILRALGARRATVFSAIVLEAATIAALGSVVGFAVYAGILSVAAVVLREQTGVVLNVLQSAKIVLPGGLSVSILLLGPLGMIAVGALAGVIPAFKAYSTDVAQNLAPMS